MKQDVKLKDWRPGYPARGYIHGNHETYSDATILDALTCCLVVFTRFVGFSINLKIVFY